MMKIDEMDKVDIIDRKPVICMTYRGTIDSPGAIDVCSKEGSSSTQLSLLVSNALKRSSF